MKKYFLVGYLDHYKGYEIVHDEGKNINMFSQGGDITYRSPGYDTLEELKEDNKVLDVSCKACGGVIKTDYIGGGTDLIEKQLCFGCNVWEERTHQLNDPNVFIIDGVWYKDGGRKSGVNKWFLGFGGSEFNIETFDGRKISTNNLWHGGTISKWWRDKLPDNAKFISL